MAESRRSGKSWISAALAVALAAWPCFAPASPEQACREMEELARKTTGNDPHSKAARKNYQDGAARCWEAVRGAGGGATPASQQATAAAALAGTILDMVGNMMMLEAFRHGPQVNSAFYEDLKRLRELAVSEYELRRAQAARGVDEARESLAALEKEYHEVLGRERAAAEQRIQERRQRDERIRAQCERARSPGTCELMLHASTSLRRDQPYEGWWVCNDPGTSLMMCKGSSDRSKATAFKTPWEEGDLVDGRPVLPAK